jgi:hypothetical protein
MSQPSLASSKQNAFPKPDPAPVMKALFLGYFLEN